MVKHAGARSVSSQEASVAGSWEAGTPVGSASLCCFCGTSLCTHQKQSETVWPSACTDTVY